jgi:CxxC motif-containing protein
MEEKRITCIICPLGCTLVVKGEGTVIQSIEGFSCQRGETYGRDEFISPKRILTSSVRVEGGEAPLVAVRSNLPLPKELLFSCMDLIKRAVCKAPVYRRDILIKNILDTGVDIIASGGVKN